MYVYLLKHAVKPTFKIGKSIDIHSRIHDIGGYESFDLDGSIYVQFPNERLALKHESFIHQVFGEWKMCPDKENRLPGDTEYFKIECFELVVSYLRSNATLFKCDIGPIPKKPDNPLQVGILKEAIDAHRKLKRWRERQLSEHNNIESANSWDEFIDRFDIQKGNIIQELPSKENGLTIIWGFNRRQFIESGMTSVGRCFFNYQYPSQSSYFGYGVIICGGLIDGTRSYIDLAPVSKGNMEVVREFGPPELTAKIEAINEWIFNRRKEAQANLASR